LERTFREVVLVHTKSIYPETPYFVFFSKVPEGRVKMFSDWIANAITVQFVVKAWFAPAIRKSFKLELDLVS
jgi:hypothetical protein